MLSVNEITNALRSDFPNVADKAVSTIVPLFSESPEARPARLPLIKRVPQSSPHGPYGSVEVVGNLSGGNYTPGGALNAPGSVQHVVHQQGWGNYQGALSMTVQEMLQLESGELRVEGWMQSQLDGVSASISRGLNTDIFTGNAAGRIDGLQTRAVVAANTYGTINRALFPNYGCQVYLNGGVGRNISVTILEAAINAAEAQGCNTQSGGWFGISDTIQTTAMEALAAGNIATWQTGSSVKLLGAMGVEVKGIPMFAFAGMPAGSILFVNADALQWEFLADRPFVVDEPQKSGDRTVWNVYCHAQLRLRNPRLNAFAIGDLL